MEIQYHEARIKKSQTIFLKPDIVHAPVMANVISALYTIIPPVSIYCSALSAFSPRCPMGGTLRATTLHCYRRRWSAANLSGAEPSLHAIPTATRSSLSFASPTFRPARTGIFWRVDTETRLETCCMCFHSSLTYIAGPCMEDVHASIGTHSREVNSAKSAIPGKRLAKADILAIGHDIVYRYTRCRDHVGGPRIYNLPTFPRLVSRVILTLLTYSRSSPPPLAPCAPRWKSGTEGVPLFEEYDFAIRVNRTCRE